MSAESEMSDSEDSSVRIYLDGVNGVCGEQACFREPDRAGHEARVMLINDVTADTVL